MFDASLQPVTATSGTAIKPLLKWPGGKRRIAREIASVFPKQYGKYFEPFAGGAALFFHLRPPRALLADSNEELINLYTVVRDSPNELIDLLETMQNSSEFYYQIRASRPTDIVQRAARIYFLMLLSFNGIFRVNRRGEFNVPYGSKTHLRVCDPERIAEVSSTLQGVTLLSGDFENTLLTAEPGDLVYLDPPYTVKHSNNGFVKYNETIFSWKDQERLSDLAKELVNVGCFVAVSNANHDSLTDLYRGFESKLIKRPSVIAASSKHREDIVEIVFYAGEQ